MPKESKALPLTEPTLTDKLVEAQGPVYCRQCQTSSTSMEDVSIQYCGGCKGLTTFVRGLETIEQAKPKRLAELLATGTDIKAAAKELDMSVRAAQSLLKSGPVIEHFSKFREALSRSAVLDCQSLTKFLTDAILTPVGEIDENSPLCESVKEGKYGTEYKIYSKSKAVDQLCQLMGYIRREAPQTNITINMDPAEQVRQWREAVGRELSIPEEVLE